MSHYVRFCVKVNEEDLFLGFQCLNVIIGAVLLVSRVWSSRFAVQMATVKAADLGVYRATLCVFVEQGVGYGQMAARLQVQAGVVVTKTSIRSWLAKRNKDFENVLAECLADGLMLAEVVDRVEAKVGYRYSCEYVRKQFAKKYEGTAMREIDSVAALHAYESLLLHAVTKGEDWPAVVESLEILHNVRCSFDVYVKWRQTIKSVSPQDTSSPSSSSSSRCATILDLRERRDLLLPLIASGQGRRKLIEAVSDQLHLRCTEHLMRKFLAEQESVDGARSLVQVDLEGLEAHKEFVMERIAAGGGYRKLRKAAEIELGVYCTL